MPDVELTGSVAGDVNSLNGKTVYVVIEDPASLFESSAQLLFQKSSSGWNYALALRGKALRTPGQLSGNLTIHACLDAQCAVHLNGTPVAVPFNVKVLPGLVLSTTRIDVSVPFGTVPPEQRVDVALPANSAGWVAGVTTPYVPEVPRPLSVEPAGREVTDDHLQLKLAAAPPGTYVETVRVHASVQLPGGR